MKTMQLLKKLEAKKLDRISNSPKVFSQQKH